MKDEQLVAVLGASDGPNLEWKEARERDDFERFLEYAAALANEGAVTSLLV